MLKLIMERGETMDFIEKVKHLREKTGLNKTEMAEALGVSRSVYIEVENGTRKASKNVLKAIAEYFGVSINWLIGISDKSEMGNTEKLSAIDHFINDLVDERIIKDPNNIDKATEEMILNAVKAQIAYKLKQKNS